MVVAFAFETYAYAQEGTIVDGNATFQFNGIPATPGSANYFAADVAGGADNVFQNWWWYRTVGDSPDFETNLNDTGLPFGPGDFTGAYQWRQFLAPGDSATFVETITIGVPEPATLSMMGLIGLVAVCRRRR